MQKYVWNVVLWLPVNITLLSKSHELFIIGTWLTSCWKAESFLITTVMFYLCQNMKLFANKLGKLRLFWFLWLFIYKKKIIIVIHLPPFDETTQKTFYVVWGCQTFTNSLRLKNIKSHKLWPSAFFKQNFWRKTPWDR